MHFCAAGHLVTAPGAAVEHRTWPPALGFAGLTSLAGVAFLPLPHLQSSAEADPRVRWAGPRLLAAVTMLLLIAAAVTSNPVSRAIAINCTAMLASIIMLASIMLPVAPLDGAYVSKKRTATVITFLLAAVTAVVVLRWI